MVKLVTTETYYDLFTVLTEEIKNPNSVLGENNAIFCEEKISLMAERFIASAYNGTFNTDVYSFGNFLRKQKKFDKLLTKEGSAMVVRKILSNIDLKCFKSQKTNLAPMLFELIIQLKSAKVGVSDLKYAIEFTDGILKNKLIDLTAVYEEYERFITDNGFSDQSSVLTCLPEIISNSDYIKNSNVILFGFTEGWTRQIRSAVVEIIKRAKNVTVIAVSGKNGFCYLNETADSFLRMCKTLNVSVQTSHKTGDMFVESTTLLDRLFSPFSSKEKIKTDKIKAFSAPDKNAEIMRVAEIIKEKVITQNKRYRDFTVSVPNVGEYGEEIKYAFNLLGIPFFLDEKSVPAVHPLITLITSYCDCFKRNFKRETVAEFCCNPFFCENKELSGEFINYLIKYNVNYERIKQPFKFAVSDKETFDRLEETRKLFCSVCEIFDVQNMLKSLCVEEKIKQYSVLLSENAESESAAINDQIFGAVSDVLSQMTLLLGDERLSAGEFKTVFLSGVSALEISVIPQYNDAVFVGGLKETALAKAENLFVVGLNDSVPAVKEDVSLLSDGDISRLENVKVLVEPKIKIVNHRQKENAAMAVTAFSKNLYLSYSVSDDSGKKQIKSGILKTAEQLFTLLPFPKADGYLCEKQAFKSFAEDCGKFASGETDGIEKATSFYAVSDKEKADRLLLKANKELKIRLNNPKDIYGGEVAPTLIEDYFKCPYKAFMEHGIKLKERDKSDVDYLSVGNVIHEVLNCYFIDVESVTDKKSSDALVEKIKEKLLKREEYARYIEDARGTYTLNKLFSESKKFCYRAYLLLKDSEFKPQKKNLEVKFGGENGVYPAISLANGKIKLTGKIDRIDTYKDYCRIIDYKTGSIDASDKSLFTGVKLQLYLYGEAVKDYKLAGVYYIPVSDAFKPLEDTLSPLAMGKSLLDEDVLKAQDKNLYNNGESKFIPVKIDGEKVKKATDGETLNCYVEYAHKVCEKAAEQLTSGVIVPSPYEGTCLNCPYLSSCGVSEENERSVGGVDENVIVQSVKGENNGTQT